MFILSRLILIICLPISTYIYLSTYPSIHQSHPIYISVCLSLYAESWELREAYDRERENFARQHLDAPRPPRHDRQRGFIFWISWKWSSSICWVCMELCGSVYILCIYAYIIVCYMIYVYHYPSMCKHIISTCCWSAATVLCLLVKSM